MPTIHAPALLDFATRLFVAAGVPDEDAAIVAHNLIGANLRGHDSHGVLRIPQYVDFLRKGDYQAGVGLKVENESPGVVVVDGQWGMGQVQAHRLLDLVLPKAKQLGLAAGTGRHFGHIGRLGGVRRTGRGRGRDPDRDGQQRRSRAEGSRLRGDWSQGWAPTPCAWPCRPTPTRSCSTSETSVAAEGKVRVHYFNDKKPVPEGWLLDAQGKPTTDPSVLYEPPLGSILPMGGTQSYKGFGLGLVLDMLAGGLTGGRSSHPGAGGAKGNNVVFLALDPERFVGLDALIGESGGLARFVRSTPRAEGVAAILLPGDPERMMLEYRSIEGIPLEEGHWAKLSELARSLNVPIPETPPVEPIRDPSKVEEA